MAELFLKVSRCYICLSYLEKPKVLKCGYTCCFRCIRLLPKNPYEGIVMCPECSVISWENEIKSNWNLGRLVAKVKDLEPQMRGILQMNPRMLKFQVDMTLDADTANEFLIVSDDLRSVRSGLIKQTRRKRAESFSHALCVLGSSRFTSGRHYWEVDVGASEEWTLGVCKESVNRKGRVRLSSELGFWTVSLRNERCFSASSVPGTALWLKPQPPRVGIFLDVDVGSISFYNVSDASHIFTFTKIAASEPLRPFFGPSKSKSEKCTQGSLCICPVKNSGTVIPPE